MEQIENRKINFLPFKYNLVTDTFSILTTLVINVSIKSLLTMLTTLVILYKNILGHSKFLISSSTLSVCPFYLESAKIMQNNNERDSIGSIPI